MAAGSPERSLIAATRGPSWAATLAAVLVLVGALDALLSYQAFALFLDADLLGTGARDAAERQAGLVGGINALAATGILTMLCIVLPQVAARLLRGDQGPTLARMPRWLRCALAALFMVAALVLAAGIGAVRYMGQLSMPSDTVSSSFAVEALEAAGLSGGAQVDATALVWSAFTAFLLFLAEMLGFALACVKGGEAARRQARLIRMERRAAESRGALQDVGGACGQGGGGRAAPGRGVRGGVCLRSRRAPRGAVDAPPSTRRARHGRLAVTRRHRQARPGARLSGPRPAAGCLPRRTRNVVHPKTRVA